MFKAILIGLFVAVALAAPIDEVKQIIRND